MVAYEALISDDNSISRIQTRSFLIIWILVCLKRNVCFLSTMFSRFASCLFPPHCSPFLPSQMTIKLDLKNNRTCNMQQLKIHDRSKLTCRRPKLRKVVNARTFFYISDILQCPFRSVTEFSLPNNDDTLNFTTDLSTSPDQHESTLS